MIDWIDLLRKKNILNDIESQHVPWLLIQYFKRFAIIVNSCWSCYELLFWIVNIKQKLFGNSMMLMMMMRLIISSMIDLIVLFDIGGINTIKWLYSSIRSVSCHTISFFFVIVIVCVCHCLQKFCLVA